MKRSTVVISTLASFIVAGSIAFAQQTSASKKAVSGKHYTLPATKETVQWGWFDVNEKPKLTVCFDFCQVTLSDALNSG